MDIGRAKLIGLLFCVFCPPPKYGLNIRVNRVCLVLYDSLWMRKKVLNSKPENYLVVLLLFILSIADFNMRVLLRISAMKVESK